MDRRTFLKVSSIGALAFAIPGCTEPVRAARKPNVVLINVDDLGWTDLSCQGSAYFETPNIDRLAAQGIRFTDGYAACAVCSPTRASIMTGRYPSRVGITDWIRADFQSEGTPTENPTEYVGEPDKQLLTPPNPFWMEHDEVTIAEMLESEGYTSCHIGKWHLGYEGYYPTDHGFDVNIGGCDYGQPPVYFDPYCNDWQGCIPFLDPREEGEYLTDREADEAVQFIAENQNQPFFLYMAHYAVHTPIQAKAALTQRYENKPKTNQDDPEYAAMVKSVDEAAGKILNALDELGLTENTLVIFTGDNGGLEGPTDNAPLRSGKGYPYEGGIRVPVLIRWPAVIPEAQLSYEPVSSQDYFPTIMEAAGIPLPENHPIDGVSLLSHLRSGGSEKLDRESLLWHFPHYRQGHTVPPYSIVRQGNWKLLKWWEGPTYELYNLQEDIGEENDLAAEMPDRVEELNAELDRLLQETNSKLPRPNPDYNPNA